MKKAAIKVFSFITGNPRRAAVCVLTAAAAIFFILPVSEQRLKAGSSMRIFSREGSLLRQFNSPDSGASAQWLPLSEFPQPVKEGVIAAEDRRFYWHPGFDPVAVTRAIIQNVRAMKVVSGGSTITQQAARMVYADILPGNRLLKKICELVLAVKLELHCSKDAILEIYLNRVPMKFNQRGLPAAAARIFGRDIRFLSRGECAALLVLIRQNQAPRENFRGRYISFMKKTWNADAEDLPVIEESVFRATGGAVNDARSDTPHFEEFVRSMAAGAYGDVKTSISANLNESIARIINSELKFLAQYDVENAAVIVLKLPEEGRGRTELIAMVGSENFYDGAAGQVNGCTSVRSAGSTLKPLLYGLAMDTKGYAPWTIINDTPLTLGVENGETYSPKNNDLAYWGPITLREALACSRNIPAVYLVNQLGVPAFYRFLLKSGFSHMNREPGYYGPGLALGAGGASLLQLCRAYSGIACRGTMYPVYIGTDMYGDEITFGNTEELLSEKTSYRLVHILSDMESRRRAFGSRNFLDFPFDVAVKTGTSKDFRDAWTVGFTDSYLAGVWVGNFSGKMMNSVSGGWGAGRIFHQVIRAVTGRERPQFRYPDRYGRARFCRVTGLPAGPYCNYCMEIVDSSDVFNSTCTVCSAKGTGTAVYSRGDVPEILSPVNGETYIIDPTLPLKMQGVPLRIITARKSTGQFYYSIDLNGKQPANRAVEKMVSLARGKHSVELYRDGGLVRAITFNVE